MNMNRYGSRGYTPWAPIIGVAIIISIVLGGLWLYFGHIQDTGARFWQAFTVAFASRQIWPSGWNILHSTVWGFIVLAIYVLGIAAFIANREKKRAELLAAVIAASALALGLVGGLISLWNNDKDGARSFAGSTNFVVSDISNLPSAMKPLTEGATVVDNAIVGIHDVPGKIVEGNFDYTWEQRVASARGADIVMSRTSGSIPNTYLLSDSLSYVYGNEGTGAWTAIRDGHNKTPVWGVVEWDGSRKQPTSCKFDSNNAINYAFDGKWGRNLSDLIAHKYRELLYVPADMWGYCNNGQATIVIPVVEQKAFSNRTTTRSAGVLIISGSPSGEPTIEHRTSVKAGELPGPAYSSSLVDQQISAIEWQAGRKNKNRLQFGFERTNVSSQASNNGNYLLRNTTDGRIYWVNPLTPRSSDSQQLTAFSIVPADQATAGQLNEQRVYVANDDAIVANLDDLESRVIQSVSDKNAGFFTGEKPGSIVEFLPIDANTWQVFAERNARVIYRIVIDSDARIQPVVYNISGDTQTNTGEPPSESPSGNNDSTGLNCSQPSQLSEADLANCISQLSNELQKRLAGSQQ